MQTKTQTLTTLFVALLVSGVYLSPAIAQQTDKPNVIVMMVDNHGWGELGVYGGGVLRGAPTPRLD